MERIIIEFAGEVPKPKQRHDGDFSDRVFYPYSSLLFCIFAVIVSTKQFVGEPIQCWAPAHFSDKQCEYANDYCWLGNSYYLPIDSAIPREGQEEDTGKAHVSYYHWIPLVLLVQALSFYFPKSLWKMFCYHSGLDVEDLVNASQAFIHLEMEETRQKTLEFMLRQLDRYLAIAIRRPDHEHRTRLGRIRMQFNQTRGWYLTFAYFFVKVLSLANVIAQLFLLDLFLGSGFHFYGFELLDSIMRGEKDEDQLAPRFPRSTMCDFKVRRLGANHRYTVQCVLQINLFNEKVYLCVWIWLVFLCIALSLSLLKWIMTILFMPSRRQYVESHLSLNPRESGSVCSSDSEKVKLRRFLSEYLQYDGVFVLRLIGHNTSSITVIELAISLWDNFKQKEFNRMESSLS